MCYGYSKVQLSCLDGFYEAYGDPLALNDHWFLYREMPN